VREATLMKRFDHPCVLPLLASFVCGRQLWMVTPFMGQGSIRSIMLRQFPQVGCGVPAGLCL
jgi:serine/threonine protein kinase